MHLCKDASNDLCRNTRYIDHPHRIITDALTQKEKQAQRSSLIELLFSYRLEMGEYRDVLLTLSHVILPPEKLYPHSTPSMNEGLPWDIEYDLRLIGCELIQTAGLLLKLPQVEQRPVH